MTAKLENLLLLNVPFRDKDKAKRLGAIWLDGLRCWAIDGQKMTEELLQWLPPTQEQFRAEKEAQGPSYTEKLKVVMEHHKVKNFTELTKKLYQDIEQRGKLKRNAPEAATNQGFAPNPTHDPYGGDTRSQSWGPMLIKKKMNEEQQNKQMKQ